MHRPHRQWCLHFLRSQMIVRPGQQTQLLTILTVGEGLGSDVELSRRYPLP
jgi:hypothetical protein